MGKRKNTRDVSLVYETLPELFTGICDAIRTKTGGSDPINHQDIPSAIGAIPTGSSSITVIETHAKTSSNTPTSYTYTATGGDHIIVTISGTYVGSDTSGVTLNGNSVTATSSDTASGSRNAVSCVYEADVVANDIIVVTLNTSLGYFEGGCSIMKL